MFHRDLGVAGTYTCIVSSWAASTAVPVAKPKNESGLLNPQIWETNTCWRPYESVNDEEQKKRFRFRNKTRGPGPTWYFHLFPRLDDVCLAVTKSARIGTWQDTISHLLAPRGHSNVTGYPWAILRLINTPKKKVKSGATWPTVYIPQRARPFKPLLFSDMSVEKIQEILLIT